MVKTKNKQPLISVIVPVYNMEKYLVDCLSGLCTQALKDIEIICIDDGSTDNSLEILKKFQAYDSRIKVIAQSNQGVSAARNAALDVAKGKYFAFVDSDDFISPYMLSKLYDIIETTKVDMVLFNHFNVRDGVEYVANDLEDFYIDNEETYLKLLLMDEVIHSYLCFRLYKRKLFDNVRFPVGKVFEDVYLTSYFVGKIKKVYYTSEPLYYYRYRKESTTNNVTIPIMKDAVDSFYERYKVIKKEYPSIMNTNVYSMLKWLTYMKENLEKDNENELYRIFEKIIKEILADEKKYDITSFSKHHRYQDVLKLIEEYNNYINKKGK